MLWTIALVFFVLWGLGFLTSYTLGGFIHILLLLALVAVAVRVIQGRRALPYSAGGSSLCRFLLNVIGE